MALSSNSSNNSSAVWSLSLSLSELIIYKLPICTEYLSALYIIYYRMKQPSYEITKALDKMRQMTWSFEGTYNNKTANYEAIATTASERWTGAARCNEIEKGVLYEYVYVARRPSRRWVETNAAICISFLRKAFCGCCWLRCRLTLNLIWWAAPICLPLSNTFGRFA